MEKDQAMPKKLKSSFIITSFLILAGCTGDTEERDQLSQIHIEKTRYLTTFSDPKNGCQYFSTSDGGLYPRLTKGGSQRGCMEESVIDKTSYK